MHNQVLASRGVTWNILVILPSPTVSANLHIGLVLVHKHGGPRVLFSEDAAPVPLDKGLHAETNLWPCSGLAWFATGELSSDQHSGWQNLANGRQWIPISSRCQFSPIT